MPLLDDATRRLRSAWGLALRVVAAGVFGLAIALTVAVFVAGPETRDEWRALPGRVTSGELRLPVVGDLLTREGTVSADAEAAASAADRAAGAASRGTGRLATPGGITAPRPFVAAGVPSAPATAAPVVPGAPVPDAVVPPEGASDADAALPAAPETAAPAEPATPPSAAMPSAAPPAVATPPSPSAPSTTVTTGDQATEVLRLVNLERAAAGCGELRPDPQLAAAAQLHSEDMSANDYMSHTSKDGRSASDRAAAQGYTAFSGENVAKGYRSAAEVMDGWMNSPGHRANILSCESVAIGVGVSGDAWTQVFGYA